MDIALVSALVAAIGVTVGVTLAYLEIRSLVRTRKTDLVIGIYSSVGTREYLEAYEKFMSREASDLDEYRRKYGFVEWNMVLIRLDLVGALLRRRLIDYELVQDLFGSNVITIWERTVKPLLEEREKRTGKPHIWGAVEYLYNEMQKREQTIQTQ